MVGVKANPPAAPNKAQPGKSQSAPERSAADEFLAAAAADASFQPLVRHLDAAAKAPPTAPRYARRIGFIGSAQLGSELGYSVQVEPIDKGGWPSQLMTQQLDLLLVESAWLPISNAWRQDMLRETPDSQLLRLLRACKAYEIPTAFWFTAGWAHFDTFKHLLGAFDRVFCADDAVAAAAAAAVGEGRVGILRDAIEPRLNNPLRAGDDGFAPLARWVGFVSDCIESLMYGQDSAALRAWSGPALGHMTWLSETGSVYRNNNAKLTPVERRRFVGSLTPQKFAELQKLAKGVLDFVGDDVQRSSRQRRRMLEAFAAKCNYLTDRIVSPIDDLVPHCIVAPDADALGEALAWITHQPLKAAAQAHRGYRQVMQLHTYEQRVQELFRALRLEPLFDEDELPPKISVILPTMRPQLVPFAYECFSAQTYPNKELLIVLNSNDADPATIRRLLPVDAPVRVFRVPTDRTIGVCLNVGIQEVSGEYWAKIDDDDYYGPEYLSDLMLQRKFTDFDITGKCAVFNYFEEDDTLTMQRPYVAHSTHPHLAGGTLLVRHNPRAPRFFDEGIRGFCDTMFLRRQIDSKARIVAADGLNYVQVRRADRTSHTWTVDKSAMILRGPEIRGLDFSVVAV